MTAHGSFPPQRSFVGGGYYYHYIPASVNAIGSDGSFSTAYTPYQAEASQGTLQALFEYQTYTAELLKMDVVNASHYDGATALAEAIRLAQGVHPSRKKVLVLGALNPEYEQICRTYSEPLDVEFEFLDDFLPGTPTFSTIDLALFFAVVAVTPDYYGRVHDLRGISQLVHDGGALFIVHTDPLYCAIFEPPGLLGADIVTAEGQPLGIPVSFGGPYLGIFALRNSLIRRMPGRLAGETKDSRGNRMFVLTLSTREQHIRREKAASNICTNQGLMALRALAYMAVMGSPGMTRVAQACVEGVEYFRQQLEKIPGYTVPSGGTHFRELLVRTTKPARHIVEALKSRGFQGGIPVSPQEILFSLTEVHALRDIDDFLSALAEVGSEAEPSV